MAKSDVNGPNANEIFKFLRLRSRLFDAAKNEARVIPWNFSKFLVSADAHVIEYFNPRTEISEIEPRINQLLQNEMTIWTNYLFLVYNDEQDKKEQYAALTNLKLRYRN